MKILKKTKTPPLVHPFLGSEGCAPPKQRSKKEEIMKFRKQDPIQEGREENAEDDRQE